MRTASLLIVLALPACSLVTVPFPGSEEPPPLVAVDLPDLDWTDAVDTPSDGGTPNVDGYREIRVSGTLTGTLPSVGFVQLEDVQGTLSEAFADGRAWTNATLVGRAAPQRLITVTATFFVDPQTGESTYTADDIFACVGPDRFSIETCDYPRQAQATFVDEGGDTVHLELGLTFDENTMLFADFDLPASVD
ncbi:MAG: hypothetical protein AAGA48_36730 [Myxococcota bacterium]